jgi:hypothetical protein
MYKATLSIPAEHIADYKKRGCWPLQINDNFFDETTVIESEDIMDFIANKEVPYAGFGDKRFLRTDPRLKIETIEE